MIESPRNVSGFLGMTGHAVDVDNKHLIKHCQEGIEKVFDRIEIIESMLQDVRETFARNSHIFGEHAKKIQKLDQSYKADFETAKEIIFSGAQTHASILKLEAKVKELEEKLKNAEAEFPKIKEAFSFVHFKKPHKCPVCDAEGYKKWAKDGMCGGSRCATCEGLGVIWG